MKNGYTQIPNELLEAKYKSFQSLTKTESAIFEVIERKTFGWHKNNDWITQSQIVKELKIDRFRVSKAVKKLTEKNMITNNKIKKKKIIGIQVDFSKWKLSEQTTNMLSELTTKYKTNNKMLSKQTTDVVSIDNRMLSKQTHTKETITKDNNIYSERKFYPEKSIEVRISKYLYKKIKEKDEKFRVPNHQLWAKYIDFMIRIDNREPEEIEKVIDWCQEDSFWSSNILSTSKLRDKFTQLLLKMKDKNKKKESKKDDITKLYKKI